MSFTVSAEQLVYGPVPSRRLGRSLGVDLVPLKTCTYDCVYCQLGRTTRKTVRRQSRVDPSDVAAQVRAKLDSDPDVIALAGSGEPTLHAGIGEVIAGIKRLTDVPVAVVTTGRYSATRRCAEDWWPPTSCYRRSTRQMTACSNSSTALTRHCASTRWSAA